MAHNFNLLELEKETHNWNQRRCLRCIHCFVSRSWSALTKEMWGENAEHTRALDSSDVNSPETLKQPTQLEVARHWTQRISPDQLALICISLITTSGSLAQSHSLFGFRTIGMYCRRLFDGGPCDMDLLWCFCLFFVECPLIRFRINAISELARLVRDDINSDHVRWWHNLIPSQPLLPVWRTHMSLGRPAFQPESLKTSEPTQCPRTLPP